MCETIEQRFVQQKEQNGCPKITLDHRDRSIHIERDGLAVLLLLSLAVLKKNYHYFFTNQILGAVAADLLYKSMPGLCLIISRAARYLPKPVLNNIPYYVYTAIPHF